MTKNKSFYDKMKNNMRVVRIESRSTTVRHDLEWGVELPPIAQEMMESLDVPGQVLGRDYMSGNVSHITQMRNALSTYSMGLVSPDSSNPALRLLALMIPDIYGYLVDNEMWQDIKEVILQKNKERVHNIQEFFDEYDYLVTENREMVVKSAKRTLLSRWASEKGASVQKHVFDNENDFDSMLINFQEQDNVQLIETFFIQIPIDIKGRPKRKKKRRIKLTSRTRKQESDEEEEPDYKTSYEIYILTDSKDVEIFQRDIQELVDDMEYPSLDEVKSRFDLKISVAELPSAEQVQEEAELRAKRQISMNLDKEKEDLGDLFEPPQEVDKDAIEKVSSEFRRFYLQRLANELHVIVNKDSKLNKKTFWSLMGRDSKNPLYNKPGLVQEMESYDEPKWQNYLSRIKKLYNRFIDQRPSRSDYDEDNKDDYDDDYSSFASSIIDGLTLIKNEIRRELNASVSPIQKSKRRVI